MQNQTITPFFMFSGQAEEAMQFYTAVFKESAIKNIFRNEDGTVQYAVFELNGQTFMCIDNNQEFRHSFTPALSFFVSCGTVNELDEGFGKLSVGGKVLMPLAPGTFSDRFGWVEDRYGISWQLNLEKDGG